MFGAEDTQRGYRVMGTKLHPKTKVLSGVLAEDASLLLKRLFIERRNLN